MQNSYYKRRGSFLIVGFLITARSFRAILEDLYVALIYLLI